MTSEDTEKKSLLEEAGYFEHARQWYSTVYLSIISERYFFIALTTIAMLTGLISLFSLIQLMPLSPRVPFIYEATNAYEEIPIIKPIKTHRTQDINDALRRFFVSEYIKRREGYTSNSVGARINFVRNHSSKEAFARYAAYMDVRRNPRSPVQELGIYFTRVAQLGSTQYIITPVQGRPNYYRVNIPFIVNLYGGPATQTTNYRADIEFFYKDLIVEQTKDMEEDSPFEITPMRFLVTDYRVRKFK